MTLLDTNNQMFGNYMRTMVDRVFKILPLYEERNEFLYKYIQSLLYELNGLQRIVENLDVDADYISLLATLEALSDDVLVYQESESVKREVFKCIGIVKRVGTKATLESGDG